MIKIIIIITKYFVKTDNYNLCLTYKITKYSLNINFYVIKFIICLCVYSKYLRKKVFDACYQFNDTIKVLNKYINQTTSSGENS